MLKKIRSLYILKKVFFNLFEKRKLKAIKYSKRLQNIMNINLMNYKIFSGKYIRYENGRKRI